MCLYPSLIQNPKYKENNKNGGKIPAITDKRVMAVPIGCGRCYECMQKKANDWRVRLFEEIKENKNGQFVTLTFSNEYYKELYEETTGEGYEKDNNIATLATRRFLERWRKKYKKSVRHWLITELGHEGTENIHLHGILFTDEKPSTIRKIWTYGHVWAGYEDKKTYVNEKTINYITKYITKTDTTHKYYIPKILTSAGIGSGYTKRLHSQNNRYNEKDTKDYYITKSGHKIALPIYYRNKLYTDEEKEKLWLQKLDKETRFVDKIKINANNTEEYYSILKITREKYKKLGYNGKYNWKEDLYENQKRKLIQLERIKEL